jgi:uncharacterized membrane protein YesL
MYVSNTCTITLRIYIKKGAQLYKACRLINKYIPSQAKCSEEVVAISIMSGFLSKKNNLNAFIQIICPLCLVLCPPKFSIIHSKSFVKVYCIVAGVIDVVVVVCDGRWI